jgi:hypothetical protein
MMLQIPVELRRHCINFLNDDAKTLKDVRLSCKDLGTLATQTLFRTAALNQKEESADRFKKLVDSPLKSLVHHVIINTLGTEDPDVERWLLKSESVESFVKAIESLSKLEKPQEVELNFSDECQASFSENRVAETTQFRDSILVPFFGALANVDRVESLTIKNLQDAMTHMLFMSEDFKAARGRLKKLHLQIVIEHDEAGPEHDLDMAEDVGGFTRALPDYWLKPMTTQLTHLTLSSPDCPWGIWPFVDLRQIPTFTRLKSLYLGNFTIAHDWQIDWIVSHSATLEELVFDDTSIIVALLFNKEQVEINFSNLSQLKHTISEDEKEEDKEYLVELELRWHHVFDRSREGLPLLQHFAANCRDYQFFEHGIGPSAWKDDDRYSFFMKNEYGEDYTEIDSPRCDKEDELALAALMESVYQRANMKLHK